jgi:hypothetical protein
MINFIFELALLVFSRLIFSLTAFWARQRAGEKDFG